MCYTHLLVPIAIVLLAGVASPVVSAESLNSPPSDFVALFNGNDLTGWQGLVGNPVSRAAMSAATLSEAQQKADQRAHDHWSVSDGVLVFDGRGDNLCTRAEFGNFQLYLDWRIEEGGDSGVYLRGSPQVQIWDPHDDTVLRAGSGGLFNNRKQFSEPLVRADRPPGEWNTFFIQMLGNRVTVELNGKLVVDNVVMENYWEPEKPLYRRGPIELQSHGSRVEFRNIYLRELPDMPPEWETLFDGASLDKWDYQRFGWVIEDGMLSRLEFAYNRGLDNTVWSKERYSDFVLDLEFKLSAGCDSGILVRVDDRDAAPQSGIEIQLLDSHDQFTVGKRDCGALYDVRAPYVNAVRRAGEWNQIRIVAQDSLLAVILNNERVIDVDLHDCLPPAQNPASDEADGAAPRVRPKRDGFLGFQDQGSPIWFRNIRIKQLDE